MISAFLQFEKHWWGIAFAIAFPLFILFVPVLTGFAVFDYPETSAMHQQFFAYKDAISRNDSFLWDPGIFSGFPGIATLSGFFSPIVYVFLYFFSPYTAHSWLLFISLLTGAFFTALFLCAYGLSPFGAVIGGFAWVSSQWGWTGDLTSIFSVAFLPILFFLVLKSQEKKTWPVVCGVLTVGLMWLMGHWHFVIESLMAAMVFALYLAWREPNENRSGLGRLAPIAMSRPLTAFFVMAVCGTLIGLIQLIPVMVYMPLSDRGLGISHFEAVKDGLTPFHLIGFFIPYFTTPMVTSGTYYSGILPLFFALYSFSLKKKSEIGFYSWLIVGCIALGIKYSPLFLLLHFIPPMQFLHAPSRWMFIGSFALSILAGFGFDAFLSSIKRNEIIPRLLLLLRGWKWLIVFLLVVTVFFTIVEVFFANQILKIFYGYFDANLYAKTTGLPLEFYHSYIRKHFSEFMAQFSLSRPAVFFPVLFLIISYAYVKKMVSERKIHAYAPLLIVLIVISDFTLVRRLLQEFIPIAIVKNSPETLALIKSEQHEGRVFTPFGELSPYVVSGLGTNDVSPFNASLLRAYMAIPNRAPLYGLEAADYTDPLVTRRMARVISYVHGERVSSEEKIRKVAERRELLNLLGVRYLISSFDFSSVGFKEVFKTTITSHNIPVMVFENPSARPRFYFASSLETILQASPSGNSLEDEIAAFEKLKTISEDGLSIFVECEVEKIPNSKLNPCENQIIVDGKGTIEAITKKNTISVLKTSSQTPQFLVFSENNLPGWKAYIDNRETPIYTTGSVYMGVAVPEGEHEVRFEFTYKTIIDEFLKRYW